MRAVMSPEVLIAFIAACILLGLTPGPNMSLILANTLTGGLRAGLVTLAGTTTGLALLVAAAAARHELDDGVHVGVVRRDPLGRRALSGLSRRAPAVAVLRRSAVRGVAAAARRRAGANCYLQGAAGQPVQPQGAAVPRRLPAAVRRSGARSGVRSSPCWPCCSSSCWPPSTSATRWRSPGRGPRFDAARLRLLDGAAGVLLLLGGLALAMVRRP